MPFSHKNIELIIYDLLNTTLSMGVGTQEEIALILNGKKQKLKADDFIEAYGQGRLGLSSHTINRILQTIQLIHALFNGFFTFFDEVDFCYGHHQEEELLYEEYFTAVSCRRT